MTRRPPSQRTRRSPRRRFEVRSCMGKGTLVSKERLNLKTVQFALKALRHPYRIAVFTIVFSFGLGLGACQLFLSKEARYLLSARNQAAEQDVRRNLGEPLRIMSNKNQETLWVYEFREFVQGGNNAWTMTGSWWCDDYTLTFDEHHILRDWTRTSRKCG
jgi:hypothetical protein